MERSLSDEKKTENIQMFIGINCIKLFEHPKTDTKQALTDGLIKKRTVSIIAQSNFWFEME